MALSRPGARPGRPRRVHREEQLQRALLKWLAVAHPDLADFTFHPANGGGRRKAEAAILVGLGVKRGVPDLICVAARGRFSGLALELKTGRAKPTRAQADWLGRFARNRWFAAWANTRETAEAAFDRYARGGAP